MKYYFLALGTLVVVCVGCAVDGQEVFERPSEYHAPPAAMMQRPGPMVDGPGPGVMHRLAPPPQKPFATTLTQLIFSGPAGMHVGWQVPDGFAENQVVTPGRYDFAQGATYRLKLTSIPNRDLLVVYPSLQVYPTHPNTDAYLAHNCVPIEISEEDLDQVESNNFVTKVIYLPDPKFQELAIAGVETLVSTRLDPGVDPVAEADRRGTIMVVLRMGNMDLETPQVVGPMGPAAGRGGEGDVQHVSYKFDGEKGQHVPPMPIEIAQGGPYGVPPAMMMGGPGGPGMPAYDPVLGGPAPMWGMPTTSTPIGLPGPPHLPYGGRATLQTHTVRNLTKQDLPKPVDHMLIDVKHKPGLSLPQPTKYIRYEEDHPVFTPGEVSYPNYSMPGGQ